jgi:hypothetical protein
MAKSLAAIIDVSPFVISIGRISSRPWRPVVHSEKGTQASASAQYHINRAFAGRSHRSLVAVDFL